MLYQIMMGIWQLGDDTDIDRKLNPLYGRDARAHNYLLHWINKKGY
jgi:hypothetical protein